MNEPSTASGVNPPKASRSRGPVMLWLLLTLVLVTVVITAWVVFPGITNRGRDTVIAPQGTVQKITFVATFGVSSQIDTEQRSFLVRGVTQLRKGARVETRSGPLGARLCDVERLSCDELMRDE